MPPRASGGLGLMDATSKASGGAVWAQARAPASAHIIILMGISFQSVYWILPPQDGVRVGAAWWKWAAAVLRENGSVSQRRAWRAIWMPRCREPAGPNVPSPLLNVTTM